jgi:hypothetical protein
MRVIFHPEFPNDIRKFEHLYFEISIGLGQRFRNEVFSPIETIKNSPERAGHFLNSELPLARKLRRRNLKAFPFFILYGILDARLVFASLIPGRSDPLTWLVRFH